MLFDQKPNAFCDDSGSTEIRFGKGQCEFFTPIPGQELTLS